jgi:hypothetical protein
LIATLNYKQGVALVLQNKVGLMEPGRPNASADITTTPALHLEM